ncbi:MAG: helicase-related protein [Hyphomicrobiaceae bacterium]|nr:helicase-related protein [Hyphomicrobiaceae bacterium]
MAFQHRIRNVTAVLGPTNTGKTHLAIERMLGHQSGMIGLPLRLLAREVYDKIVARVGPSAVALVTGEEKIKPEHPRYWVSTVEAMPREIDTDFLAIDEIQLAADPDRGHVFTDRLLHARGRSETLLLGAGTMREAIADLIPEANFISRPRLSKITYSGQKKITRLPKRSAIVAFSAAEVYSIAELIRRQLGGAAVVLGALSPRTRNAQVALYQSGDVDYLVATDAIGMGLNLDVDHVAFASVRKFDGNVMRNLTPSELAQIAGRAGRHMNDGTFGVTGDVEPLDADLIERLESHTFDTVRVLQWRNRKLDFASVDRLRESLREMPGNLRLQRARMADDVMALETISADSAIAERAIGPAAVQKLWEVCQVPDYRKISSQSHAELVAGLYGFLMGPDERIPEDWFAEQVARADRTDGDIDTLATRIAHIRTWTFVSNRSDWLKDPVHWQERTRAIEDSLSDALHEQLAQRFVDRRTSALMKGLRDKDEMTADIGSDGAVTVEGHYVGRLKGFRFQPDAQADSTGVHGKASRGAAAHVLSKELAMRARRVAAARSDAFKLGRNARILWREEEIARIEAGDDPLKPTVVLIADEHLTGPDREKIQQRLDTWIGEIVSERLKPLVELKNAEDVTGLARGIAFRMTESYGILKRDSIADDMRQLDQPARAQLRKYGVRFGAFNIFLPPLLKPAPAELTLALWTLNEGAKAGLAMDALPDPPRAGLTSVAVDPAVPEAFYRAAGYHVCGPRAIRVDMLERLADSIRPLLAWRPTETNQSPPRGSSGDGGFMVTPEMMSILGCSAAELSHVLAALGFRSELRPKPNARPEAPMSPVVASEAASANAAEAGDAADGDLMEPAPEAGTALGIADVDATPAESVTSSSSGTAFATSEPETSPDTNPGDASTADDAAETATPDAGTQAAQAPSGMGPPAAEATPAEGSARPEASEVPAQTADSEPPPEAIKSAAADSGEAPAPQMVEVWRPRRRHREARRPRRHDQRRPGEGRRDSQPASAPRTEASEGGATSDQGHSGRQRQRDRDRNRGPSDRPGARDQDRNRPATATEGSAGDRDRRREGDRGKDQTRDRPAHRDDRRGGGGGERRHGGNRDDRGPRPQVRSASPQRKGGPDPDSPFAALSALKQQLEKQGKS